MLIVPQADRLCSGGPTNACSVCSPVVPIWYRLVARKSRKCFSGLSNSGAVRQSSTTLKTVRAGTADLYRFQNTDVQKPHSHQCNTAPALSGLPPDPAPPLRPHSQSSKLCETAELAALPRGCLGAPWSMTPYPRTPHERAVSPVAWRGLDWRRGVGRLRRTVRRPSGALGGLSNMRPIVLADCGLLNTRRDTASAP